MYRVLFVFVFVLLVVGCTPPTPALPASPQELSELEDYILSEMEVGNIPGLSLVIVQGDSVEWANAFGVADIGTQASQSLGTTMRVGSISKTMVALVVMILVEQDLVSLDDRLDVVLPYIEIDNPYGGDQPILIRHLLEHTSGLRDEMLPEVTDVYANEDECELSMAEILDVPLPELQSPPGEAYSYSNLGYTLLAAVIEQVMGEPFEDVAREQVFGPLDMTSTDFRLTPEIAEALAIGYRRTADALEPFEYRCSYVRPGGDLHSSAEDLARFLMMLIGNGATGGVQVISSDTLLLMQDMRQWEEGREYGFGLTSDELPGGERIVGHAGGQAGFNSHAWFEPDTGVGVVVLINCSSISCIQANERVRDAAFEVVLADQ